MSENSKRQNTKTKTLNPTANIKGKVQNRTEQMVSPSTNPAGFLVKVCEKDVKPPESDFAEFFFGVISKLYDMKCRQISYDVKSALGNIRAMKHEDNRTKQFSFSYKIPPVRCAYLYGYSVLHSVMIYSEFSKHIKEHERYMLPTLSSESLKICCIGGGSGTEALAICKSINDFVLINDKNEESLKEVTVTVVDKLPHWKREETAVINAVNDKSNVLHSEKLILHSDFLKADLFKPFEKNLKEKIKEADIVTFIKVASNVQEIHAGNYVEDLESMIRNVIDCMEDNSCLFMLDNSGGNLFYNLRDVLKERTGPLLLTESNHKDYILEQRTLTRLSHLMRYNNNLNYQPVLPTGRGKVSSCMWIKNRVPVNENTGFSSSSDLQLKSITVLNSRPQSAGLERRLRKQRQKELAKMKEKYPDVLIISNMKSNVKKRNTLKSTQGKCV